MDAWYKKKELVGKSMAYAHWARWDDTRERSAEMYKFRFKVLASVEIGPHAYTLVFTDGLREELISYDTVCAYTVDLAKS
jgi:hypothetical protein